jgi:Tol biopolymer transport system component
MDMAVRRAGSMMLLACFLLAAGCGGGSPDGPGDGPPARTCDASNGSRIDAHAPESIAADWGAPVPLGAPIRTACPEDAIEIAADGSAIYFLHTNGLLGELTPSEIFAPGNGTYRAERIGGAADFGEPVFFDLGKGTDASLDGEPSFTPNGGAVYFHSLRGSNTGYARVPPVDDILDIYVADIMEGEPGPARNLGPPVNSIYPDGEHALHPDGVTLYFTSSRPGGLGGNDIWTSVKGDSAWSEPVNLGSPVNSAADDLQPCFIAAGDTVYFTSNRDESIGSAIYRSARSGGVWGEPELVIRGIVGEPSLTADGRLLYFVHVLSDAEGLFDADIWYSERVR